MEKEEEEEEEEDEEGEERRRRRKKKTRRGRKGGGYILILDVLRPVNREGSYGEESKSIRTTRTNYDSLFNTRSIVED